MLVIKKAELKNKEKELKKHFGLTNGVIEIKCNGFTF